MKRILLTLLTTFGLWHPQLAAAQMFENLVPDPEGSQELYYELDDMTLRSALFSAGEKAVKVVRISKWPNGILPIEFHSNYPNQYKSTFFAGCKMLADVAHVQCVQRTSQKNYIQVMYDPATNNSFVGMKGGRQLLRLANTNKKGIIAHELIHALGFTHQHNSPERDTFIKVNLQNVKPGKQHNFRELGGYEAQVTGSYDFCSIMHYSEYAFSIATNKKTIEVRNGYRPKCKLGQRDKLTASDAAGLVKAYGRDPGDRQYSIVPDFSQLPLSDDLGDAYGLDVTFDGEEPKTGCEDQGDGLTFCYDTSISCQSIPPGTEVDLDTPITISREVVFSIQPTLSSE